MKQDAIRKLGQGALLQLARQLGLRGAWVHDAETLRPALVTYLEEQPREGSEDQEADPDDAAGGSRPGGRRDQGAGLAVDDLPPALKTETMARLLETQGKETEAQALRKGLRGNPLAGAAAASPPEAPPRESLGPDDPSSSAPTGAGTSTQRTGLETSLCLEARQDHLCLSWRVEPLAASNPVELLREPLQIEVWIWRANGSRLSRRIAVTEPRGERIIDLPADAAIAAAVLGQRKGGTMRPLARSSMWRAQALVSKAGSTGSPRGPASPPPGSRAAQ
ncbi:MAG: hypothetical protein RBU30_11425 [Polyangia bacterium]|jgi:hypothetical protein|nr:hypothetical protein [Polyangia bacterium]